VVLPPIPSFRPDTVITLNDTVAIWDWTYTRRPHTFTLVGPNGRQYLLQAENEEDMNGWIASINWAATFKSTGIKMRSAPANPADSRGHSRSGSSQSSARTPKTSVSSVSSSRTSNDWQSSRFARQTRASASPLRAVDGDVDSASQPCEVLASSSVHRNDSVNVPWEDDYVFKPSSEATAEVRARTLSHKPVVDNINDHGRHHHQHVSRSDIVRSKVAELDAQIASENASLQADLRIARNLAVLTPFLSSTRQRIEQAVEPVAKRVRRTRQLLCKTVLWREVLSRDLLAEDRETTLHIKAPSPRPRQESPKSPRGGRHTSDGRRSRRDLEEDVASDAEEEPYVYEVSRSDDELRVLRSPGSGVASGATPRIHRSNTGDRLVAPPMVPSIASSSELEEGDLEEPVPIIAMPRPPGPAARSSKTAEQSGGVSCGRVSMGSIASTTSDDGNRGGGGPTTGLVGLDEHPQADKEEAAEEWDRTRAAKRVSLVNLPDAAMLLRLRSDLLFPPSPPPTPSSSPSSHPALPNAQSKRLATTPEEEDRAPTPAAGSQRPLGGANDTGL
jgi:hypothetical protein